MVTLLPILASSIQDMWMSFLTCSKSADVSINVYEAVMMSQLACAAANAAIIKKV